MSTILGYNITNLPFYSQGYTLGPLGYTGPMGNLGYIGFTGFTGYTGYTGYTGAQGRQGSTGYTGYTGYTGVQGRQGPTGITGYTGPLGYTGAPASSSLVGKTGVTGISGVTGYTGLQGNTGNTGPTGPIIINNQFVVAGGTGANNCLIYSTNGRNWKSCKNPVLSSNSNYNVCSILGYNGIIWVAAGAPITTHLNNTGGSTFYSILYSNDGINWFTANLQASNTPAINLQIFTNIAWNGSTFFLTGWYGSSYSSPDGRNWTIISKFNQTDFGNGSFAVEWLGTKWVVAAATAMNTSIYTAPDLTTWTTGQQNIYTGGTYVSLLVYNGKILIIGATANSSTINLQYCTNISTPTFTFTPSLTGSAIFSTGLYGVAWNGFMWVGVGSGTANCAYSYDGIIWTANNISFFSIGRTISWNGEIWIAGSTPSGSNCLAYSLDGINWYANTTNLLGICCSMRSGILLPYTNQIISPTGPAGYTGASGLSITGPTGPTGPITVNNQFVVAGGNTANNILYYSYNGIKWFPAISSTPLLLDICSAICYNGSIFVAGGGTGNKPLIYSYNGINWFRSLYNATNVGAIGWNGSNFFTAGDIGGQEGFFYSPDGITWTQNRTGLSRGYDIVWLGNQWIMVGDSNYCTSITGIGVPWSNNITLSGSPRCLGWNGILILFGFLNGEIRTAFNNVTPNTPFTLTTTNAIANVIFNACNRIAWNGYIWVAVGSGTNSIATSNDGITWIGRGAIMFTTGNTITWNGEIWIAGGTGGSNTVAYSVDGINWYGKGTSVFSTSCAGICSARILPCRTQTVGATGPAGLIGATGATGPLTINNTFVFAGGTGSNTLSYSTNGYTWTRTTGVTPNGGPICFNGNMFISVGGINGPNNVANISYSYNGINWYKPSTNVFDQGKVYNISWNGRIFLTTGTTTSLYSTNGITWNSSGATNSFDNHTLDSIWLGDRWFLVGQGQGTYAYMIATTGINDWTGRGNLGTTLASTVGWNGSILLVGFVNGNIFYATSLFTFVQTTSPFTTSCNKFAWNGTNMWVAVGTGTNSIAYSTDGIIWTGIGSSIFSIGYSVVWNGEMWIAGGTGGTSAIAYSIDGKIWRYGTTGIFTSCYGMCSGIIQPYNVQQEPYINKITNSILIQQVPSIRNQSTYTISIGRNSGNLSQQTFAIAIGNNCGNFSQGGNSIAIGNNSGFTNQNSNSIAIGNNAGYSNQQGYATAIGFNAGAYSQGSYAVAIGYGAAQSNQAIGSICIHASNSILDASQSGTFISPIRAANTTSFSSSPALLLYDITRKEIGYSTLTTTQSKTFVIQHPIEEDKYLVHSCVESPNTDLLYRGHGEINSSLIAVVELPEYAKKIGFNWSINVQCNDICNPLGVSYKLVKEGKFIVTSPNTCTFSWSIYGQRINFDVEPLKESINIKGDGPYKWVE